MSLSPWMAALSRGWLLLVSLGLWMSLASGVRADESRVVLWLAEGESNGAERERALRLELEARGIMLLTAAASAADADAPAGPSSREALARRTLARSEADAVLWLEGDPDRPVSWLRVVHRHKQAAEQAPLPHPPDAIKPELFAIAAASLLEQVLQSAAGAAAEPTPNLQVEPAAAAAPKAAAAAPIPARPRAPAQRAAADRSEQDGSEPAASWFVEAGLTFGLAYVMSGMEAATRPPEGEIFTEMDGRHFFDDQSPWVPDADSFDDFENPTLGIPRGRTPVPGNCTADGKATGPLDLEDANGEPFTQLEPSRFCARVEMPGVAFVPALRVVLGRWLLPRFALGILYQWYFGIEPDSFFGNQLFGLVAEYLVLGARGRAVTLSLLGGLTVGRTETPGPLPPSDQGAINVLSGPAGVQGGALLRVWPTNGFGLFAVLTLGERFPAQQLTADLSAGVEVPF